MSAVDPAGESRAATAPRPPGSRSKVSKQTNNLPQHLATETRKRTNSLGTAHSACHTCKSKRWECDRERPRCFTCTRHDVLCGGFEQALNWQPGIASRGKMKGRQFKVEDVPSLPLQSDINKPLTFIFFHGSETEEKAPVKRQKSKTKSQKSSAPTVSAGLPDQKEDSDCTTTEVLKDTSSIPRHSPHKDAVVSRYRTDSNAQSSTQLPRPVGSLYPCPPKIGELLSFYEMQFARTTITYDVKVNPWQCSIPMVYSTLCLKYAVTALSQRHWAHCRNDSEDWLVLDLKDRALSTFSRALLSTPCEALIATTLAFIGLEYADTGFSDWTIYLDGAYRILESTDGLNRAATSSTLRCQIAMLLWWDITAALLSMRGLVFPYTYLDRVLSWSAENPGEWSYMSLNGCPDALLLAMYNLASSAPFADQMDAADVRKLELSVYCVNAESPFNATVNVGEDETSTADSSYMSPSLYPSASVAKPSTTIAPAHKSNDAPANHDNDLVNCWRLSMFLYLNQVFYRSDRYTVYERDEKQEKRRSLSRSIINLVLKMPPESNWQKQCLLPVVLAGFELEQQSLRDWAKSYCSRWKILTGLWVFGTAGELLDRVWERMDLAAAAETTPTSTSASQPQHQLHPQQWRQEERRGPIWWGDVVTEDARTRSEGSPNPNGYLFG